MFGKVPLMPHFAGSAASIFYEQTGAGPDIVWVGGGGSCGRDCLRFQTPHFDPSFRSTVYDNRGIGTTLCDTPLPWGIADFARDAAELARAVCDGPVAFVGSSLGSAIVQQIAIDHPEIVRRAIVMAPMPGAPAGAGIIRKPKSNSAKRAANSAA
jgi:pimeloyl-ACP methyl ester carboxylesterase